MFYLLLCMQFSLVCISGEHNVDPSLYITKWSVRLTSYSLNNIKLFNKIFTEHNLV